MIANRLQFPAWFLIRRPRARRGREFGLPDSAVVVEVAPEMGFERADEPVERVTGLREFALQVGEAVFERVGGATLFGNL